MNGKAKQVFMSLTFFLEISLFLGHLLNIYTEVYILLSISESIKCDKPTQSQTQKAEG